MAKLVCFDFDNVIINNKILLKMSFVGRKLRSLELGKEFLEGTLNPKKFNRFMDNVMQLMKGTDFDMVMRMMLKMRVQKGAREVFSKLSSSGYKIAIISINDEIFIEKFLEKHRLDKYVSHVYAARFGVKNGLLDGRIYGDIIKTEKTGVVPKLEKKYGVRRNSIIYVGDGLTDLPIMKKVGRSILFNPNSLTKVEVYTDRTLKRRIENGSLLLAESKDLRKVLDFIDVPVPIPRTTA